MIEGEGDFCQGPDISGSVSDSEFPASKGAECRQTIIGRWQRLVMVPSRLGRLRTFGLWLTRFRRWRGRREQVCNNPITRKRGMSMSANPKRQGSREPQPTSAHPKTRVVSVANPAREEEIRLRAYEIYLERGQQPGSELDDWLQAERELERGVLRLAPAN
jgi:Protein of unknown function (DUF2934)